MKGPVNRKRLAVGADEPKDPADERNDEDDDHQWEDDGGAGHANGYSDTGIFDSKC